MSSDPYYCKHCWGDFVHNLVVDGDVVRCAECDREVGDIDWHEDKIVRAD